MTDPERAVLVALTRRRVCSRTELIRITRLATTTVEYTTAKLVRMGRITGDETGYRLTGAGRSSVQVAD